MKKSLKLMCILSLVLCFCFLTGCGNKLSDEEEKIFDAFSGHLLQGYKDPSSARVVQVDKYYENGKYVVLTIKGANSYGGTVSNTYILFLEDVTFTEEFCEENCSESIKARLDMYAGYGIKIYNTVFHKGDYYSTSDIPSSVSDCTIVEASVKAILTGNVNEDISIDVGKLNERIEEYIEDMGW